jgi:hypothetical protein
MADPVTLGILGGAGILGGILGSREAAQGAEEAAQIQADALRDAAALQQQQFETTRRDYIPYAQLGSTAAPLLSYMATGIMPQMTPADLRMIEDYNAAIAPPEAGAAPPTAQPAALAPPEPQPQDYNTIWDYDEAYQDWRNRYGPGAPGAPPVAPGAPAQPDIGQFDPYSLANAMARQQAIGAIEEGGGLPVSPLYDWQKEQITEDINRQLAARGRSSSTFGANVLSDAYRGLAAEESQRQYGRLLDLTNIGRGAQGSVSGFGAGAASGAGNALGMAGGALGAGQQQAANIRGSTYANLGALPLQLYSQYQYLNALQPRQQPQQQLPPPQQQQQPYYP